MVPTDTTVFLSLIELPPDFERTKLSLFHREFFAYVL